MRFGFYVSFFVLLMGGISVSETPTSSIIIDRPMIVINPGNRPIYVQEKTVSSNVVSQSVKTHYTRDFLVYGLTCLTVIFTLGR